ncbi:hypothetical protein LX64_01090 [Chitinophaga skermanii]|uniref:DUF2071 domain-containing protein n=1 Tax=Chitinophaga skermanii TaxID=331697 RepID=A0A327QV01_9BACT|nr:DUF2071 domain-containing protein [Chitinophaga skermanii]RAJ08439.1 hypothetical protein LX64_01090 [Chitinophaga skermanii]
MEKINIPHLLSTTAHLNNPILPTSKWLWHQLWTNALFFHWTFEPSFIQSLLPDGIEVDTVNGAAWVSLVAFTMEDVRPRNLLAVDLVSYFHEVNVRTYVKRGNDRGVYFFSLEAGKRLPTLIAKQFSGMPYEYANIQRQASSYTLQNQNKQRAFSADYTVGPAIEHKTALDIFLTERYHVIQNIGDDIYKYTVHHLPWPLSQMTTSQLHIHYPLGDRLLTANNVYSMQYSTGVRVVAWKKEIYAAL